MQATNYEPLRDQLRSPAAAQLNSEGKLNLWRGLASHSFTRALGAVWLVPLMDLLVRLKLHIVGRCEALFLHVCAGAVTVGNLLQTHLGLRSPCSRVLCSTQNSTGLRYFMVKPLHLYVAYRHMYLESKLPQLQPQGMFSAAGALGGALRGAGTYGRLALPPCLTDRAKEVSSWLPTQHFCMSMQHLL